MLFLNLKTLEIESDSDLQYRICGKMTKDGQFVPKVDDLSLDGEEARDICRFSDLIRKMRST
jgi:hypothetical protein